MARSLPIDYRPGPPPAAKSGDDANIIRWVQDELYRISESLIAQPVALTAEQSTTIDYGLGPPIYVLLFPTGGNVLWDIPGGSWNNPTLGVYTVPQDGLFDINCSMVVDAFGGGNKTYFADIRLTIVNADGTPDTVLSSSDGGDDDVPLGVTFAIALPLMQGDTLTFEMAAVHEQLTGTTGVSNLLSLYRISG